MARFQMPFYQTDTAERTLAAAFGSYAGESPLLAIGASDVKTGETILFDSGTRAITPKIIAAAIPILILFSPVDIDGRFCWDAELRSNTLLSDVYRLLQEARPRSGTADDYLFIIVDMLRRDSGQLPSSAMQSHYRFLDILLGDKLEHDREAFEVGNAYLDALERLRALANEDAPSPMAAAIEEEYQRALGRRHARVEFMHISREHFEFEYVSRDFDYSPQYIDRLIRQGVERASKAIDTYQAASSGHFTDGVNNERLRLMDDPPQGWHRQADSSAERGKAPSTSGIASG